MILMLCDGLSEGSAVKRLVVLKVLLGASRLAHGLCTALIAVDFNAASVLY